MSESEWPKDGPVRMSAQDKRDFVRDWIGGKLFTSMHLDSAEHPVEPEVLAGRLKNSFMPLVFLKEPIPQEFLAQTAMIWERLDQQMPRSCNGYPMFASMRFLHREDWREIAPQIQKIQRELDAGFAEPVCGLPVPEGTETTKG